MNTLLPVLAYCAADHTQAERVLDLIALYRNRAPQGYLLLVAAPDTHPEMHKRMEIAAHIGFDRVGQLVVPKPKEMLKTKAQGINHLFQSAAVHIGKHYKSAFLWLEPDSVPLKASWLELLSATYDAQHKLYMGAVMSNSTKKILGRVAVYPQSAWTHILPYLEDAHKSGTTWEFAAAESLVNRATKTRLIQQLRYDPTGPVRADAVLFHGDKEGLLTAQLIEFGFVGRPGGAESATNVRRADPLIKEPVSGTREPMLAKELKRVAMAAAADEVADEIEEK